MGIFQSKTKHKGPAREISATDRAIIDLKATKNKLNKERQRIDKAILREVDIARELIAAKRRERALLALKKKKLHEQQLENVDAFILNIEQVLCNIDAAQRQNRLFSALKEGNDALAGLQKLVTLDDVDQLMSDSAAAKEYEGQIRQALGESLTGEEDEAALSELTALEEEILKEDIAELPTAPEVPEAKRKEAATAEGLDLPEVPSHALLPSEPARAPSSKTANEPLLAS